MVKYLEKKQCLEESLMGGWKLETGTSVSNFSYG